MCDVFAKTFIECMKKPIYQIKEKDKDKCKKEFERWDVCYQQMYPSFKLNELTEEAIKSKNFTINSL